MKKLLKWLLGLTIFLLGCVVVLFLAKDFLVRKLFVVMVERSTGYSATVDKMEIGVLTPTLRILGLHLNYPRNQGGAILLDSPEIFVEYDRDAAARNEVHLKQLRWDIREGGVQDPGGAGTPGLMADASKMLSATNQMARADGSPKGVTFTGIDLLELSLGTVKMRNGKDPSKDVELALGVQNRKLTNVVQPSDLMPLAIELAMKAAFGGGRAPEGLPLPGLAVPPKSPQP